MSDRETPSWVKRPLEYVALDDAEIRRVHGSECAFDPPCDLHALLAENQRLRDALERVAEWPLERTRFECEKFARAALAAVRVEDER